MDRTTIIIIVLIIAGIGAYYYFTQKKEATQSGCGGICPMIKGIAPIYNLATSMGFCKGC